MKSEFVLFLFPLFAIGVFGKSVSVSVSVKEGDSVTLHTDVPEIKWDDEVEWRFNGTRIARVIKNSVRYEENVKFKDRLQLDTQTGDLKITNLRITDSECYKLEINRHGKPSEITLFHVSVVSDVGVKSVSVMEGDSVTLNTDLTEIQRDGVIQWRFEQQESPIAEINRKAGFSNTYDVPDGIFRDRLQLDQTGSLTITHISATHAGRYEVDITSTSSRYTVLHTLSFSVTVRDDVRSVSVMEGDSVTLHTDLTEIQTGDKILWKFEDRDEVIADLNGPVNNTWDNINLNPQTRDLNISNIERDQRGDYKVEIITIGMILHRKYSINVDAVTDAGTSVSVKEGEPVTLQIDVTEIQNNELAVWMFGDINLAEINKTEKRYHIYGGPDKRFKGRLELDYQAGSLTITDTRNTHSGDYDLKISSSRFTINRRFTVSVTGSGLSTGEIVGIVVAGLLVAACAVCVILWCRHRYLQQRIPRNINTTPSEIINFDLDENEAKLKRTETEEQSLSV